MGGERRATAAGMLAAMAALALPAAASAQTEPAPEGARRWRRPHRGFLVQGRIGQSFGGASVLGGLAGLGAVGSLGATSALGAALGYRGGSWSIAFAPSLSSTSSGDDGALGSSYKQFGLGVLVDRVLARAADDRVELGLLAGASLSFVSYEASARSDDGVTFGLLLGLSARYWMSPAVAVGAELGESYTSAAVLSLGTAAAAHAHQRLRDLRDDQPLGRLRGVKDVRPPCVRGVGIGQPWLSIGRARGSRRGSPASCASSTGRSGNGRGPRWNSYGSEVQLGLGQDDPPTGVALSRVTEAAQPPQEAGRAM